MKQYGKLQPLFLTPDQRHSKAASPNPLLLLQSFPLLMDYEIFKSSQNIIASQKARLATGILWFSQH